MLGSMRANKKNQTVIWVILALLGIGLIGFGGAGIGGGTIRTVGQVGDEEISTNVYAQALNRALSEIANNIGHRVTAQEAQTFGVQSSVLENLLTIAAIDNETANLGISIGDEAVRNQLLNNPAFQGLDGTFDVAAYNDALYRAGLTPAEYDNILRKEASRVFLQTAIANGIKSHDTQTMTLVEFERETRDFVWAELTADTLADQISAPTDTQIQEQYDSSPLEYTAPLTREITYAWLSPTMLTGQVDIDEELIRESYDLQSDRFNKSEKRSIGRIAFDSMEDATAARNLLDSGNATFNTLLADRDLTPEDVDLGEVERGGLQTSAADVVFSADSLGVVGPVQSSVGPAIFNINAILEEDITSFEDAREELLAELSGEAARRLLNDLIPDIDDMLAAGDSLEILAKDTNMELGTISFSAETSDGIAAYENFRTVANQAQLNDFAEVKDLADGGIFALRIDEIKQPALRPLDDVKDQVVADWKRSETVRRLNQKAESLRNDIDAGASFGSLVTHQETDARRAGYIENTPPELIDRIFTIAAGKTIVVPGVSSVFIARLGNINSFDDSLSENQALRTAVQQQLDAQIGQDLLDVFANALRDEAGITINQVALNQINAQLTGGAVDGGNHSTGGY